MKKVFLLFVSIIMFSCSSDDDVIPDVLASGSISINPPSWIQGKWTNEVAGIKTSYTFTKDDVCQSSLIDLCAKQLVVQASSSGAPTNVNEVITNDYYLLETTIGTAVSKYEFKKIANDKIEHVNDGSDIINTYYTLDK